MNSSFLYRRAHWLNFPGLVLLTLLQRTPVLRVAAAARDVIVGSPIAGILRSAFTATASLGAIHTLAGATTLVTNEPSPLNVTVGVAISTVAFGTAGTTSQPDAWDIAGQIPPGLSFSGRTTPGRVNVPEFPGLQLTGTPAQAGTYSVQLRAFDVLGFQTPLFTYEIIVAGGAEVAPTIAAQPADQPVGAGATATFTVTATGEPAPSIEWQRNGTTVGSGATLTVENVQPANTGLYAAVVTNSAGSATSRTSLLGINSSVKIIGTGDEFADIQHPNGNVFDQILLRSAAATITADSSLNQITRMSYVDLNDDIVQIEFSGPGSVSVVLEGASGPAAPVNYNQENVQYMKGHAGIVVTGATENTHLSVFSVGRGNAVNQGLFKSEVDYDGFADISFIAIQSSDGKFGGLRTANASYWNTQGFTGVYAPGVQFTGPLFVHDIEARESATPVLMIGSALGSTLVTGGNLQQTNGRAVQVSGLAQLRFADGTTSHYKLDAPDPAEFLNAQTNQGQLEQDGVNVTASVVVNP